MNLEKDVAKLIMDAYGLQDGERFHIQYKNSVVKGCYYMFEDGTLKYHNEVSTALYNANPKTFEDIIYGRAEIIKIPWKPEFSYLYWTYIDTDKGWGVVSTIWLNSIVDTCRYKCGIVFRTEEEALKNLESKKKEFLDC